MGSKIFGMTASHPPGRMVSSNNILKTEMDVCVRNGKRSSNNILFSTLASILNDGEHMVIFHEFFQKVILPIHQFTIQESIYLKWEIFMKYPVLCKFLDYVKFLFTNADLEKVKEELY